LYVAAGRAGIRVIDISNPATIFEVGYFIPDIDPYTGYQNKKVHHIAVVADHAYATFDWGELRIVDISNPSQPVQIGASNLSGDGQFIVVVGDYAYVAIDNLGLTVLDISDPTHPSEVGEFTSPIWKPATGIALSGNLILLARGCTLQLVDISQPVNPLGGATYTMTSCSALTDVEVSGSFVYLVAGDLSMSILEIIDSETISVVFGDYTDWWMNNIAVVGNLAYVGGFNEFFILDLTTVSTPEFIGQYLEPGRYKEIVASGDYAYAVTDYANGALAVWNISDPSGFIQLGVYPMAWAQYIAITDTYLYISTYDDIRIMDITDPIHPVEVGVYDDFDGVNGGDVLVVGNSLYGNEFSPIPGLRILDISDPLHPKKGRLFPDFFRLGYDTIFVRNGNAYMLSKYVLFVVDVSDPANPVEISRYSFPDGLYANSFTALAISSTFRAEKL
jgi:hypothetical protein